MEKWLALVSMAQPAPTRFAIPPSFREVSPRGLMREMVVVFAGSGARDGFFN
jgi:hypothetical protein